MLCLLNCQNIAFFLQSCFQIVAKLIQICYRNVTYLYHSSYIFVWEIFSHTAVRDSNSLYYLIKKSWGAKHENFTEKVRKLESLNGEPPQVFEIAQNPVVNLI